MILNFITRFENALKYSPDKEGGASSEHRAHIPILKAGRREKWPLTFSERQMVTEQAMAPDSVAYNINHYALRIEGEFHIDKFKKAVNDLAKRHAILRSYYPSEKGEYTHRIADRICIPVSLTECEPDDVKQMTSDSNKPFDLSKAPLLRFHIYKHSNREHTVHLCVHHIIIDGLSMKVFQSDLFELYAGNDPEPVELDYLDHAVWQQDNTDFNEGEALFREMFSDGVPETDMPTVPIRPDVLPFADEHVSAHVNADTIKSAATKFGVTRYGIMMSALGITLGKYCGSEDIVVGTAMSGRTMKEQTDMIGMFVNTLPVRLTPRGSMTVSDYITQTAATIKNVKANETYPFERLVPVLAPDRSPSRSPVFDLIFNYLHEDPLPVIHGATVEQLELDRQALAIDLQLEAIHRGDMMDLTLSYSSKLYYKEVIVNFMEQYAAVLERLAKCDPEQNIIDISRLPDSQRIQILEDFSGKKDDAYKDETVVGLFRRQAKATPDNRAAVFLNREISYRQLDDITDRLAAHLASLGVGKGSVVGIMVERGMMMPIGALAVLKSGAAYLPMDPAYPSERLQFMVDDARADIIISDPEFYNKLPNFKGKFIDSGITESLPAPSAVPPEPSPRDLLILLYTSGTTGNPKGVMILHKNLANFLQYYCREYRISATDNIPAYASFGFDACMMDMYPTLISGACLHIIPEKMRLDLTGLARYFDDNNISIAFMTTQLGRQFAETMEGRTLRALSIGGESLTPLEPPAFDFYNLYGPTECTIISNRFKVDKLYSRVPIGKPLDNTSIYIIDQHGDLAPVGVAGEMCISGRQVSKGYLNRPDLTEEKFADNPFSDDPDYATMYKSGDVARFLPSGDIDFIGRRDFQVKIRGFRVELTEIEGRIREYEGINDATVIAQEDAAGGKRIVAYVVSDSNVDIKALNSFIGEELPAYMIPAATMQIERMPLNQNGKVNRKELPKISIQAEEIVPAATELQKDILHIVSSIIGMDDFGITTDLMYAGLNSLSSIKAAAAITEKTGKQLSTMDLMREKTVEKIAALLEKKCDYVEKTFEKRDMYPLTQNQLGLYFACVKDPVTLAYNIPFALSLDPGTDVQKLRRSILDVIDAHPYIKTHFTMKENEPMQLRRDHAIIEIPYNECTQMEYEKLLCDFVRPFNFFEGELFRIELYRTENELHMLCDFHHIIFDGGSMDIFLRDLSAAYNGARLKSEDFTSFDLALAEEDPGKTDAAKKAEDFFRSRLGDGEGATSIPEDGEANGAGHPETVRTFIVKSSLDDAVKGLGITPSNLFLAATAFVTGRFASVREARIAYITNGRDGAQLQNNIGMLVKTLPMVLKTDPDMTAEKFLKYVHQETVDVLEHQAYSYLRASSDWGYDAQLLYAYQGGVVSEHTLGDRPMTFSVLGLNKAKFPISVNIQEAPDRYTVEVEYDDAVFGKTYMKTFSECIANAASILVSSQDKTLSLLSLITGKEESYAASFDTRTEPLPFNSLQEVFEDLVSAAPDAPALTASDGTLSYGELNRRANALAHSLLDLGIERGDRIAFMLPRDSRIIISMLGIIKAGCAYIPVDPDYPEDRIKHILSDSDAGYILTDGMGKTENSLDINELLKNKNTGNPLLPVTESDLCYMIYTSGSTGRPKGVMLTHGNIINYVLDKPENLHVQVLKENRCTMVSVTTVSFDMFLKEAFSTLMNGLRLVLADDEQSKNPDKLASLFRCTGADAFNATPSRMLQYMELDDMKEALSKCKVIMAGGEGYPTQLYERLRDITDALLINTYGPTETTVSCNGKLLSDKTITVGPPLYGVTELVMDIEGHPLPAGVTGELWIGGNGVAKGYFGNSELTAQRFCDFGGILYYRSGDLARITKDGEVIILGRNDGQIKLRGLRIELGEVENVLSSQTGIKSCVVLVKKLHGQEHLCAYFTADHTISIEDLRESLARSLTKYMVPTAYLQLESMPMTPNGKIDRKSLPDAKLMQRENYEAPKNEAEQAYCEIFQNILHMERIGVTENFFDLGGTSLLVTQVTIDAAARGFTLSYSDVFANPTPRELAGLELKPTDVRKDDDICSYDYDSLESVLKNNTLDALRAGKQRELGNVCITGATGFLGIHVLCQFLRNEKGTAYCVVRGGRTSATDRLKSMLVYYFSDGFDRLFGSRIVVIDGDITRLDLFDKLEGLPIDTYINCAANVKHFSAGTDIEDINVGGVENSVAFCKKKGCRFIQISTVSIAGMSVDGTPDENLKLDENMLYFGQDLSNKYTHSKFLAERITLEAIRDGMDGKIMRVGNLMARQEDGEFQANFKTNNFLGRIKAYHLIGRIPYGDMGMDAEFAPIDCTASAILLLARTPEKCCIFHPYNDHSVFMGDIIDALGHVGIDILPCETEDYKAAYTEAMLDRKKARHMNSLIAYKEHGRRVVPVGSVNCYTSQALLRYGFQWPITTQQYLSSFFETVKGLGFFDRDMDIG